MKGKRKLGKFILVGVGIAVLYWVLQSAVMALIFNEGSFVEQMFTRDMHELWMRSVGVSIIAVFVVYTQLVVAKRKRVEQALRESNQFISLIFDSITDFFTVQDTDYNIIKVNKAVEEVFGKDVLGKKCYEAYQSRDNICPGCPTVKVLATGERAFSVEQLGGHGPPVEIWAFPMKDERGDVVAVIEYGRDITERKQAEEALRESEKKYRSLVTNVKLGIFRSTSGAAGRFLEVNPSTEEITGYSREELLQMNVSDLYVQPEEREEVLKEAVSTEGEITRELYFRKKDGTIIAVSNTKVAVRDSEGRILFFDGILEDITKRKRAEEELMGSRKELRDLFAHLQSAREEERKRIAREVHDEMGQELTALKINLSWLAMRLSKGQELLLDKIKSMLKRVDVTIQTVKRISAELRPALLDDFGLAAAIEWQVGEFRELTGIRCELILNPENIIVDEDPSTAIFRIVQETLTNVARHAEATKVTVDLKERANKLVLKVSDNGRGITEKEISHPKSFGLIGMRERARSLGGEVKFLGAQDEGTTVIVSIPLKKENLNAENPHR